MGVRFHKILGYGVTGLSINPKNMMETDDPRINLGSSVFSGEYDDYTDKAYLKRLENLTHNAIENQDVNDPNFELAFEKFEVQELVKNQKSSTSWEIFRGVTYEGEYGDASTLIVVPPGMSSVWSRYGDAIDHAESYLNGNDSNMPVIRSIGTPLYPFYGWMNSKTGESVTLEEDSKRRTTETLLEALDSKKLAEPDVPSVHKILLAHLEQSGFESVEDYKATIVPIIPAGVRDVCRWLDIFTDDDGWKNLRPMLYTYWG